jgi:hypothetical protein
MVGTGDERAVRALCGVGASTVTTRGKRWRAWEGAAAQSTRTCHSQASATCLRYGTNSTVKLMKLCMAMHTFGSVVAGTVGGRIWNMSIHHERGTTSLTDGVRLLR